MKIEKRNPRHWAMLLAFFVMAIVGALLRCLSSRREPVVILYGHKLNGNLLALYRYLEDHPGAGLKPVFLNMDRVGIQALRAGGRNACWAGAIACARLLSRASALVSDHGLHSLQVWRSAYQRLGLKFFDVWHGMSTMDYRPQQTAARHGYDEIWVASDLYRSVYTTQFGFEPAKVVVTGHARTDRLVARSEGRDVLREHYGLPLDRKLILFAPTWKQQSNTRSLYPFGCDRMEFLMGVAEVAARHGASVVMRSHLNSGDEAAAEFPGVYMLPASRYPDTEAILQACDVLVCDWSTIAFDWLLLDRPALFLDVEPPYPLGRFLGAEFRYGEIIAGFSQLLRGLEEILGNPDAYWQRHLSLHQAARNKFYGEMADGNATGRCVGRMISRLRDG